MFPKIIFWKYKFIAFCSMRTNTKTLTKLFFRAGNLYSALSSIIFGSLLGTDCRIFRKLNESSHMMSCVFLSYTVAENKHGG
jgi:hypothetical protein